MSWRRVASARPPPGGVLRSFGHGLQVGPRVRELCQAVLDGFKQHDLLTYSSAISFQIITAVVVMFVLALAGVLHLNSVWRDHVAPEIHTHVSAAVFSVLVSAVSRALSGRAVLWATLGGVQALWQVSGAVRAVMGAFDRIYGASFDRPFVRRYVISFALAIAIATGAW
jgi:uncharacterized BrkB/YihY/UPF0761 family membrane protein